VASPGLVQRVLTIAWPSFVMAGVLEALVFVVVDPADFRWFGHDPLELSRQGIYSVTFLLFWAVISTSGALTAVLNEVEQDPPRDRHSRPVP